MCIWPTSLHPPPPPNFPQGPFNCDIPWSSKHLSYSQLSPSSSLPPHSLPHLHVTSWLAHQHPPYQPCHQPCAFAHVVYTLLSRASLQALPPIQSWVKTLCYPIDLSRPEWPSPHLVCIVVTLQVWPPGTGSFLHPSDCTRVNRQQCDSRDCVLRCAARWHWGSAHPCGRKMMGH